MDFCSENQKIHFTYDENQISEEINRIYSKGIQKKCEEVIQYQDLNLDVIKLENKIYSLIKETIEQNKEIPNFKNEEFLCDLIKECAIENF